MITKRHRADNQSINMLIKIVEISRYLLKKKKKNRSCAHSNVLLNLVETVHTAVLPEISLPNNQN